MNLTHPELLARIEAFEINAPGVSPNFSARLARENGWSLEQAKRVVAEYKRFLYLAMVAGHPVTPSEDVDQAWHLHMVYTRSYWTELCGTVLGQPLHHDPTTGGRAEGAKFHDWYAKTLESYEREFGSRPPTAVWPKPKARFSRPHPVRVAADTHWVIRKPWLIRFLSRVTPSPAKLALILAACLLIPGCSSTEASSLLIVLLVGSLFLAIVISAARSSNRSPRGRKNRSGSSDSGGASFGFGCGASHSSDCDSNDGGGGGSSGCSSGCGGGCGGGGGD